MKKTNLDEVTLKNARETLKRILAENERLSTENKKLSGDFEEEMNIKNHLYAYILTHGHLDELTEYNRTVNMSAPGGHKKAVDWLLMQLPENQN